MNAEIFFVWIQSFDGYTVMAKESSATVLVDSALCRGSAVTILSFDKLEVLLLPTNSISSLQTLDVGMFALIEKRYH